MSVDLSNGNCKSINKPSSSLVVWTSWRVTNVIANQL